MPVLSAMAAVTCDLVNAFAISGEKTGKPLPGASTIEPLEMANHLPPLENLLPPSRESPPGRGPQVFGLQPGKPRPRRGMAVAKGNMFIELKDDGFGWVRANRNFSG